MGILGGMDGSIDPRFLIREGSHLNRGDDGVHLRCYEARRYVRKLTDITGTGSVDIAHGIPNIIINLVGPPLYISCHYRLSYCPLFILRQQENGGMVRLAEWGKKGSLVASLVVQSYFPRGSTHNVLTEVRHDFL